MKRAQKGRRGAPRPVVFTPSNEPYLGRRLLVYFDEMIVALLAQSAKSSAMSHERALSDREQMAAQVIPQALSIALSIRELIRQGYLFGGHVLLRALVERVAILHYIYLHPKEIERWKRGWHVKDAPSLAQMLEKIQATSQHSPAVPGRDLTASMNSLLHAKPDSAGWNLVPIGEEKVGHAPSKILNRPDLCDDLCGNVIPWLVVLGAMMAAYFPEKPAA